MTAEMGGTAARLRLVGRAPLALPARRAGGIAADALARHDEGRVLALFQRSFYLDLEPADPGKRLICIAAAELHDGPLTLRVALGERGLAWCDLGLAIGQPLALGRAGIRLGEDAWIRLDDLSLWQPARPAGPPADWPAARAQLERPAREGAGLARLVLDRERAPANATERLAAAPLTALRRALAAVLSAPPARSAARTTDAAAPERAAAERATGDRAAGDRVAADRAAEAALDLLGLGPGLTPSGDDLLAGMLLALDGLERQDLVAPIGARLLAAAPERTTRISRAHLAAAALGQGAAPLHDLLTALASDPQRLDAALHRIARIG
jgi:hypothetical protein